MDLIVLDGPNFSGRTAKIRDWVGLPQEHELISKRNNCAFIGPNPVNSLSGLAPTVATEIELMATDREAYQEGLRTLDALGFGYIRDQNPFTLSGGEQVVCTIVAAMAGRPTRLGIDCAFEQLASETRSAVMDWLAEQDGSLMLADNRLNEWYSGSAIDLAPDPSAPILQAPHDQESYALTGPQIELIDMTFGYTPKKLVLDHINFVLEPGQTYRLAGKNGSGKSTLSKILTGLLKPIFGEIRVDGKTVRPWTEPGRLAAYHFQNPMFQMFGRSVGSMFSNEHDAAAVFRNFGTGDIAKRHPLDLPYVAAKRVALGATLLRPTAIKILDEPTLAQDRDASGCIVSHIARHPGLVISHSKLFADQRTLGLS